MPTEQQIQDDGAAAFVEWIRKEWPRGSWNALPKRERDLIEKGFDQGYMMGRKD